MYDCAITETCREFMLLHQDGNPVENSPSACSYWMQCFVSVQIGCFHRRNECLRPKSLYRQETVLLKFSKQLSSVEFDL